MAVLKQVRRKVVAVEVTSMAWHYLLVLSCGHCVERTCYNVQPPATTNCYLCSKEREICVKHG